MTIKTKYKIGDIFYGWTKNGNSPKSHIPPVSIYVVYHVSATWSKGEDGCSDSFHIRYYLVALGMDGKIKTDITVENDIMREPDRKEFGERKLVECIEKELLFTNLDKCIENYKKYTNLEIERIRKIATAYRKEELYKTLSPQTIEEE